ncbi:MAG: O-antigen ligase family protein [Kiritimatiellia bacterium]|nr:O-antigen ligase family protein [Kiritimatiellia bacterium]MDP6847401.1 O-antigen ligase family protein [Kiritimatiellia bacterium]
MKRILPLLNKALRVGIPAVIVVGATQYAMEVANDTYLSLVDIILWLMAGIWGLTVLLSGKWREITWPPLFSVLFVALTVASAAGAEDRMAVAKEVFQMVEYFVVAFMLFHAWVRNRRDLVMLARIFLGATSAILLMALVQYFGSSREVIAVGATFGNRNVLGGFLSLAVPVAFGLLLHDSGWKLKTWYAAILAVSCIVLLSGASYLALLLAFAIVSALTSKRAFLIFAIVAVIGSCFVLPRLPRDNGVALYDSISLYNETEPDVSRRYPEWQAACEMIRENPLMGVGAGNYQRNIGRYYGIIPSPAGKAEPDTQNLYLVMGSSIGLPGLVCFIGLLLLFAGRAARRYFVAGDAFEKGLSVALLGALIAYMVNSLWSPLLVRGIGIPLALVLSLVSLLEKTGTEEVSM